MGENEMKPNCPTPQNVRLSEWLGGGALCLHCEIIEMYNEMYMYKGAP